MMWWGKALIQLFKTDEHLQLQWFFCNLQIQVEDFSSEGQPLIRFLSMYPLSISKSINTEEALWISTRHRRIGTILNIDLQSIKVDSQTYKTFGCGSK
jgi:hypothetical protein